MAFVDDLDAIHRRLGHSIILPTPPACLALIEAAKAAGIPIGTLFILSRALSPSIRGSYDRKTGDLWCHFNGSEKNGAREVLQCLLTLIAYVKLQLPPPVTIEQDWDQARSAHREAFTLARAWGREGLFTKEDLRQFLADDTYYYRTHRAAGMLAGNLDPYLARSAYLALLDVQVRYQWSDAQFEAALSGEMEEDANAAVLDFDRCQLRAFWLSTSMHMRDNEPDPFGEFALPSSVADASTLRSALEQTARHHAENRSRQCSLHTVGSSARVFLRVTSTQDLSMVIEHVNAWLLEALPQCYARVQWGLYADRQGGEKFTPTVHLYQMRVEYDSCLEGDQAEASRNTTWRELWMLFPVRDLPEVVEAAWQRYIRSWLACTTAYTAPLYHGLQSLWSWLEQEPFYTLLSRS